MPSKPPAGPVILNNTPLVALAKLKDNHISDLA